MQWAAREAVRSRTAADLAVQDVIAEYAILVETSRALMHRHVAEVADRRLFGLGVQAGIARCALVKYVASNTAVRVIQRLVDVVGGAANTRALPYERMWRDAQAGTFMPMANMATRRLVGANALGVQTAPTSGDASAPIASRPNSDRQPASRPAQ